MARNRYRNSASSDHLRCAYSHGCAAGTGAPYDREAEEVDHSDVYIVAFEFRSVADKRSHAKPSAQRQVSVPLRRSSRRSGCPLKARLACSLWPVGHERGTEARRSSASRALSLLVNKVFIAPSQVPSHQHLTVTIGDAGDIDPWLRRGKSTPDANATARLA